MIEELVGRVFATRNAVHLAHFKTKSFAQHVALGEFYDGLVDKIDSIVEMYQGECGLIGEVDIPTVQTDRIMQHISGEADWIAEHRDDIAEEVDAIKNVIDELVGLYLKTHYKLKYLS